MPCRMRGQMPLPGGRRAGPPSGTCRRPASAWWCRCQWGETWRWRQGGWSSSGRQLSHHTATARGQCTGNQPSRLPQMELMWHRARFLQHNSSWLHYLVGWLDMSHKQIERSMLLSPGKLSHRLAVVLMWYLQGKLTVSLVIIVTRIYIPQFSRVVALKTAVLLLVLLSRTAVPKVTLLDSN